MSPPPLSPSTIIRALRLHPRIAYQGLFTDEGERARLVERLPSLVPFRRPYHGVIALVDWDHRLPSRRLALRVFLYYDAATLAAGQEGFDDRLEEIGARDRFPEFDVPDFADLPADEAYEAEADVDTPVFTCRLTSAWRRDVDGEDSDAAIEVVRASDEFSKIASVASDAGPRAAQLGDLEAVSWTPPCESGHPRWTLDVWYLLTFDGRLGNGRSLLVDLEERRVVSVREFSLRTG